MPIVCLPVWTNPAGELLLFTQDMSFTQDVTEVHIIGFVDREDATKVACILAKNPPLDDGTRGGRYSARPAGS